MSLITERTRTWGKNIERGRDALGMTQAQLAEAVGVTQQAVSSWEQGLSTPRDEMRLALAEVLHQDVAQLFPLFRNQGRVA